MLLKSGGIAAGEACSGADQRQLQDTAAVVSLHRMDQRDGMAELSVQVLTPRKLGLWNCQRGAGDCQSA